METMELLEKYFDVAFATPAGVKRLRELILSLAMQGKLVPQDPSDQPASELLKEIEAEKKRLVKEGKIKKYEKLPEVTLDEISYEIPKSWEWVRLNHISIKIHYGYTASANHESKDIRLLRITDIQDNKVNWESVPGCEIREKDIDQYLLSENDILIARTGGTVGKSFLVQNLNVNSVFASYLIRVVPSKNIDVKYLKLFIESPLYWKQLYEKCSGTGQPNVNGTALSNLFLTLPPLAEQRRIVEKIDKLMCRCDELEKLQSERNQKRLIVHAAAKDRLLSAKDSTEFSSAWEFIYNHFGDLYSVKENVSELRKVILQLAVMGKLVPQDPNDEPASELLKQIEVEKQRLIKEGKIKKQQLFPKISIQEVPHELPKGWSYIRLGELGYIVGGGTPQKSKPEYWNGTIPWISPKDMKVDYIIDSQDHVSDLALEKSTIKLIEKESLLIVVRGMILAHSFPTAINNTNITINQDMKALIPFFLPILQYLLLTTKGRKNDFLGLVERSTHGTCRLETSKIFSIVLAMPPLAEQKRIVAKVDQLMKLCDQLEQKIEQTTGTQTTLLNAVMANL